MQKVKVTKVRNIYKRKKRSMYNMIHANQQNIQWKQYSIFSVYQVDEHNKSFPVQYQFINLIKVVLLSIKKQSYQIKQNFPR